METRKRPIQVRPRRGSNLDRAQDYFNNNMADVLHSWADGWAQSFKDMVQHSEEESNDHSH